MNVFSLAVRTVLVPLALVLVAVGRYEEAMALCSTFREHAFVAGTIWPGKAALSVPNWPEPLPCVLGTTFHLFFWPFLELIWALGCRWCFRIRIGAAGPDVQSGVAINTTCRSICISDITT